MKTIDEILDNYKEYETVLDDRFGSRLCQFLTVEQADKIGSQIDNPKNHKPKEWTEENVLFQLKRDVELGWERGYNQRCISAGFMYEVVKAWCKILGNGFDAIPYGNYGIYMFMLVAKHYGWELLINKENEVMRPDKNTYYLNIAAEVAKRSTCLRRQYGAVIVKNDEIIATGYNGSARGEKNCCNTYDDCPRASKPHNSGDYSDCPAVHAEMNAIISAARKDMIGAIMYLAGWENGERIPNATPCPICSRLIKNAGIHRVISKF